MRYILGFLATIGLIILILVLLLRGGSSEPEVDTSLQLSKYATSDSMARFIIDGPVVADQEHDQLSIEVDANQVKFTLYRGYEGEVVKEQTYPNNQDAYTIFLKSLQREGFTNGNNDAALRDERGICPLGQRRIYAFSDGSKQLMRYWSTGCDDKTFKGSISGVATLFRTQVPNYSQLVSGTQLSFF